jgi:hypothetical protein
MRWRQWIAHPASAFLIAIKVNLTTPPQPIVIRVT